MGGGPLPTGLLALPFARCTYPRKVLRRSRPVGSALQKGAPTAAAAAAKLPPPWVPPFRSFGGNKAGTGGSEHAAAMASAELSPIEEPQRRRSTLLTGELSDALCTGREYKWKARQRLLDRFQGLKGCRHQLLPTAGKGQS